MEITSSSSFGLTVRMRWAFFFLMKLILLAHGVFPSTIQAQEFLPALIKQIKPAVVTVTAYDNAGQISGAGSGFFVRQDHLITNHHVMVGAHRAEIKTANGNRYPVLGVLAENKESDLILLKVEFLDSLIPLDVIPDFPEAGERVIVVGSPFGFEQTVSDGIVSSLRVAPGFDTVIQITAPFSPGSSGSPVINLKGKVIGVASRQMEQGQNLNFAVPGKWVLALTPGKPRPVSEWGSTLKKEGPTMLTEPTVEQLGKKGEALLDAGKYEEALSYFEKVAQKNPDIPEVWVNIGSCQAHLGRWEEAIFVNERAIDLKPDLAIAHYNLGGVYGMLGRWKEALEAYQKTLRIQPNDADALAGLAWAQANLGYPFEAIETCRKAIRINPKLPEPYRHLAYAHLNLGRFKEAVVYAKKAIELKPDYVDAYQTLGNAYGNLGRYQDEIETYKEALRLEPNFAGMHSNLGLAYAHLNRWPEAIEEYKEAIRLKPEMVEAHYNLGVAYFTTGDKASALDEYKILQKLNKELADRLFSFIYK